MAVRRVLLAITVYNGRGFVPRCLRSAARLREGSVEADVVVLDDASPDLEFAEEVRALCTELGLVYYRAPRNLGIVRNVNLGLGLALDGGYDAVVISNSDVVYPSGLLDHLAEAVSADPTVGSATAWSNNVSVYSLPNEDPDAHLSEQQAVDDVSAALWREFGSGLVDIPAGISFSMMITTAALRSVGLMDPVFGRGYCEETDWSRRSLAAGFRLTLAPGCFVYHQGRGSTEAAGLVKPGESTVHENERIIDQRYPTFRQEVGAFLDAGVLDRLWSRGRRAVVAGLAARRGWDLDVGWLPRAPRAGRVRATVPPSGSALELDVSALGFRASWPVEGPTTLRGTATSVLGGEPGSVVLRGRGRVADQVSSWSGVQVSDAFAYPEPV